jgi:hypothetical protein
VQQQAAAPCFGIRAHVLRGISVRCRFILIGLSEDLCNPPDANHDAGRDHW